MTAYKFDCFPVDDPVDSFKTAINAQFGSIRDGGVRKHAGCDLYVDDGAVVRAVADGVVNSNLSGFYQGTFAIVIDHGHFICRYGELQSFGERPMSLGWVKAGDVVGYVKKTLRSDGKSYNRAMLHFELYSKQARGSLTVRDNKPTQRRKDLVDPTLSLNDALCLHIKKLQLDAYRHEDEMRRSLDPLAKVLGKR